MPMMYIPGSVVTYPRLDGERVKGLVDRYEYESTSREQLVNLMAKAEKLGNQHVADGLLVDATRWLRNYPYDAAVWEARENLRAAFPPRH
jgi:hypothetical protein